MHHKEDLLFTVIERCIPEELFCLLITLRQFAAVPYITIIS